MCVRARTNLGRGGQIYFLTKKTKEKFNPPPPLFLEVSGTIM